RSVVAVGGGECLLEPRECIARVAARIVPASPFEQITDAHARRQVIERRPYAIERTVRISESPLHAERSRDLRRRFGRLARPGRIARRFAAEAGFRFNR